MNRAEQRLRLPRGPAGLRAARGFLCGLCAGSGLTSGDSDVAELLTSEVVANAFCHAGSGAELSVRLDLDVLRVEVRDQSPVHPRRLTTSWDDSNGRGVAMLDRLARTWGVVDHDQGKTVWFEVELAGARS